MLHTKDPAVPKTRPLQPVPLRLLYTAIIFIGHLSGGMVMAIASSALVDLRYLQGDLTAKEPASMSAISLQSTFFVAGACAGGFISFLYNYPLLNRQLVTSILSLATAAVYTYTPYIHSVGLFYGLSVISGFGLGNQIAIANIWLIEMWTGRLLAGALQALQLSYGIGSILGPLLVRPHLYGYIPDTEVAAMNGTEYESVISRRRASLVGPYAIVGGLMGIVALLYTILYFTYFLRYRPATSSAESPTPSKEDDSSSSTKLFERPQNQTSLKLFLFLLVIIFAGNNAAEIAYMSFQDAFLQSLPVLNITASEAAFIGSITATSYTTGRGLSIVISMILSSGTLLLVHYGLVIVGVCALFISTTINQLAIQLNAALLGYAFSAIMPAMFAYINLYAIVTDRRNALFTIALSAPNICTPLLIGKYLERSPKVLVYLVLSLIVLAATVFTYVKVFFVRSVERKRKGSVGGF